MSETQESQEAPVEQEASASAGAVDAILEERSGPSLVWLVPIVAGLIGAWLAYTALTQRGPQISIRFESAAGLEAGKTKIKFKDVEVGQVESITLSEDLSHVDVTARLAKGAQHYLTDRTRFWVVRARVSAGQISGLTTLLSGAYIAVDPSLDGESTRSFVGLERPPAFTFDEPGRLFNLRSESLGSLDVDSPVYYRSITVGRVVGYQLDPAGDQVTVQIFVRAPHDRRVRENTRFWNASGIDVSMGPDGVEIDSLSLTTILIGGIGFETPLLPAPAPRAEPKAEFSLYPNKRASERPVINVRRPFLLYFEQSAAGLAPGSPVEFRGIVIGEVRDVSLEFDPKVRRPRIPVLIDIEPERIKVTEVNLRSDDLRENWNAMVAQGLRAQLITSNLLTGQLAVSLDFHPKASPAEIDWALPVPELPTVASPIEELRVGLGEFLGKLNSLPLESIGKDLEGSLERLNAVLGELEATTPALTGTLEEAERTLSSVDALIASDSQTSVDLKRALRELADGARALRLFAEELEQNPESLIRGRQ